MYLDKMYFLKRCMKIFFCSKSPENLFSLQYIEVGHLSERCRPYETHAVCQGSSRSGPLD